MNQKQGRRSTKKEGYYKRQFLRTEKNKANRAARILRRKHDIPNLVAN